MFLSHKYTFIQPCYSPVLALVQQGKTKGQERPSLLNKISSSPPRLLALAVGHTHTHTQYAFYEMVTT